MISQVKERIQELLEEYGFNEKEVKVMSYLLKVNKGTIYSVMQNTNLHRANIQNILESLTRRGFLLKAQVNGKTIYELNDLKNMSCALNNKQLIIETIKEKLPEFKEEKKKEEEESIAKFSGINSLKSFNFDLIESLGENNKECYVIGNMKQSSKTSHSFLIRLLENLKDRGIKFNEKEGLDFRIIWDEKFREEKELIESFKAYSKNTFIKDLSKYSMSTIISGDTLIYIYSNPKPQIIKIKNPIIVQEMKNYFQILWKNSKN